MRRKQGAFYPLILGSAIWAKLSLISVSEEVGLIEPQSCVAIYLVSISAGNSA